MLAFRTLGKSNIDFAPAAFSEIASRPSCDVVALDIKGFFDNLDHKLLKKAWAGLLSLERLPPDHFCVFSSLTKWCWVNKKDLYAALGISVHNPKKGGRRRICAPDLFRTIVRGSNLLIRNGESKGIPQGSPMSALLSNIYMISFDQAMSTYTASVGAKYFRYCDDMIVIAPSGTGAAVKQFAQEQIKKVALEIQDEKTEQRTFTTISGRLTTDQPLQYLGFVFDGRNIRIRDCSVLRYFEKMRRGVAVALMGKLKVNNLRLAEGRPSKTLHRKKLYMRYSYLGRRNFVSYGHRSAATMSSKAIGKQVKGLWNKLREETDR